MKKYLLSVTLIALIMSCTNTSFEESTGVMEPIESRSVMNKAKWQPESLTNILQFKSESEFEDFLNELSSLEDDARKYSLVEARYGEFYSLKKVYDTAMLAAGDLDESEESFMEYKNSFSPYLYFSEYADDCGAYLPVKNKNVAFLLNANGEVIISGIRICKNDVTSYADLQEAGVAMYEREEEPTMTRGWSPSYISHSEYAFSESSNNVGMEYDSGWWQENKRKVRVKCGRKVEGSQLQPVMKLHIEVSFRKKTWLGWANYVSETTTTGTFTGGYNGSINFYKNADSSHDWYQNLTNVGWYVDPLGYPHLTNPYIDAELTLDFRGIGHLLYLSFRVPYIDATMPNPTIFPN